MCCTITMLIIKNGSGRELVHLDLPNGDFTLLIGRQEDCNVQLMDGGVSRHHAELSCVSGRLYLLDKGSSGGTFVNGQRISARTAIAPGTVIMLGTCMMFLEEGRQDMQERTAPKPDYNAMNEDERDEAIVKERFKDTMVLYEPEVMALMQSIHKEVVDRMNLESKGVSQTSREEINERAVAIMEQVLRDRRHEIPVNISFSLFKQALKDNIIDLGPIAPLVRSNDISEIMVNGPDLVFIEMKVGNKSYIVDSGINFYDEKQLVSVIQRIVERVGRRIDDASPMVDARLTDGSRVNAIIPPLVLQGSALTIRKFSNEKITVDQLINWGSMSREMATFLEYAVRTRRNILVSGGTGSGKTTLLNVLSQFIPKRERVITVEDSAELKLDHKNLLSLEARPANAEGKGRVTIRDLVINTLRMRPDRIIVGECRGAEALDMLQAMNTGHDGSMTTAHANEPRDVLSRLENMVMMAGFDLPSKVIREQIASAINIIVQQTRLADGSRKIVQISEITGREDDVILLQDIFQFVQTGIKQDKKGKLHVEGYHTATGNIPNFIEKMRKDGNMDLDMSVFVPKEPDSNI